MLCFIILIYDILYFFIVYIIIILYTRVHLDENSIIISLLLSTYASNIIIIYTIRLIRVQKHSFTKRIVCTVKINNIDDLPVFWDAEIAWICTRVYFSFDICLRWQLFVIYFVLKTETAIYRIFRREYIVNWTIRYYEIIYIYYILYSYYHKTLKRR